MFQFPSFSTHAYLFSMRWHTLHVPGFPIRTSPVQCLLAAPRGFSQLATSFLNSWRQGIRHVPLLPRPLLLKSASQVSSGPLLPSSARRCEKRPSGGAAFAGYDDRAASNGFFHPGILSRLNYCYAFPLLSCQGARLKSSSARRKPSLIVAGEIR